MPKLATGQELESNPPLDVAHAIDPVAREWDCLADRMRTPPFVRPGWIGPWWRAFGSGRLEIVTLRQDGRLVGLLPLCRRRGALFSPTNWHTPGFGLMAEPGHLPGLVQRMLPRSGAFRRVSLAFVDSTGGDLPVLLAVAKEQRYPVVIRTMARSACVEIDGDWDAYERSLSRNVRSNVGRSLRRLQKVGEVSFEQAQRLEGLDSLLTECFRIEASGWKGARGTAIVSHPETERFYREVAAWAAQKGWLRIALLRLDGQALAFELGIDENNVHYALKSGFDQGYSVFSPSKLLMRWAIEQAFSQGMNRYEMGNVESYKLVWANAVHNMVSFRAFAPSPTGRVAWSAFRFGEPPARRILAAAQRSGGIRRMRQASEV